MEVGLGVGKWSMSISDGVGVGDGVEVAKGAGVAVSVGSGVAFGDGSAWPPHARSTNAPRTMMIGQQATLRMGRSIVS